jgi:hypothetical protein
MCDIASVLPKSPIASRSSCHAIAGQRNFITYPKAFNSCLLKATPITRGLVQPSCYTLQPTILLPYPLHSRSTVVKVNIKKAIASFAASPPLTSIQAINNIALFLEYLRNRLTAFRVIAFPQKFSRSLGCTLKKELPTIDNQI